MMMPVETSLGKSWEAKVMEKAEEEAQDLYWCWGLFAQPGKHVLLPDVDLH